MCVLVCLSECGLVRGHIHVVCVFSECVCCHVFLETQMNIHVDGCGDRLSARACVGMHHAELALPSAGLLSQSLEFSSPADNYTVCEGDNATLRYGDSEDLPGTAVLPPHCP